MDNQEMREFMRHHMNRRGITQQMLADKLGITQGAVSQVLRGKSAVPRSFLEMLDALDLELVVQPKG